MRLAEEDIAHLVYAPVLWQTKPEYINVSFNHMGCTEVRVLLSGNLAILAFPISSIPGGELRAKRVAIVSASREQLEHWVQLGGFAKMCEPSNSAIIIPNGFLIVMASGELGAKGLRWCLSGDPPEVERTRINLKMMLASFPELRGPSTGYQAFSEAINAD